MARAISVRRARRQLGRFLSGFLVTWDVDSRDPSMCAQVRRFIFGITVTVREKSYRYSGFVEREGVRYVGQSVLFVTPDRLGELRAFLRSRGVDHVAMHATIGSVFPN
jgi:hypothetical protein